MSEKLSTVILKVDLQCVACTKKIKKTLCKLRDREGIRSVIYDEKNNSVTISGPFDPRKLIKKICCKACKVIKDIQLWPVEPPNSRAPPPPRAHRPEEKKPDPGRPPPRNRNRPPEPPAPEPPPSARTPPPQAPRTEQRVATRTSTA
ncbi:protein PYRICULARIA ORYZAE RESISTANCE 21-like [Asparagus officinalis]|uniref:protein PYRICULARIA ORYZAE RESISTANCE 21-like n=1 Tax=Asparagus officinalis TaxID=4686 RepID=UPI00098E13D6|nr:protein PYRICULARIA ORYZAE RESISTANCE 21-like [Asparagus officinalis]